jgi:3-hydroxyisobutyrate dehydrogenase-like beta-hydroxyacid dehydrogenase
MTQRIGMVGLGLMGSAFATNLLRAGIMVRGFDTDSRRMDEHAARGGELADSPADAARGLGWVLTSLPDSDVSRRVALGPGGIAEGASEGLIVLDATTPRPEDAEALGADLAAVGIHFMDSCVSGTSLMAQRKDLVVIAGGSEEDFERSRPVFAGFSRAAYHVGDVGAGALMKLLISIVLAGNRLALAESLVMGTKAGMDPERVLEVLIDSAAFSKTMLDKGPKMISGDYSREGQMKSGFNKAGLFFEQARRFGSPALVSSVFAQVQQAAMVNGYGDSDSAAMIEVFRELAGLPRRDT